MTHHILRLLWLGMLFVAQAAFAEEPLTIGVFAFRDKAETVKKFQPLADYLERTLPGQRFVLKSYTYDELETAIERREVDFVLSHAAHYVAISERNALSSPLATMIEREKNQPIPVYGGAIIVRADRGDIAKLADLKGKTVATSSIKGFASYQMQAYELHKSGLEIPGDVKVIQVELPIDRSVIAVLDGKADAAFARMGLIEQMAQEGKLDLNRVKVLNPQKLAGFGYAFSTTLYPLWPFVAMPQVSDSMAARVAAALLMLPHDGETARAAKIWGFTIPANYDPVKDAMQALRVAPFDEVPEFSWYDVWRRYTVIIIFAIAAVGLILLLLFWLTVERRKVLKSKERFRTVADHTYDWEYWQGPNREILYISPSCERVTGYSSKEFVADPELFNRIVLPADRDVMEAHLHDDLYHDEALVDFRIVQRDGGIRWISHGCRAVYGAEGQFLGRRASNRDDTERKLAEQQLRSERDFIEGLINIAPTIVLVLDTQGRIVRINPYMEAISGYTFAEVQGKDWFNTFLPKSKREQTKALFLNAIDNIQTRGNEDIIVTRTGQERIIEWNDQTLKDAKGRTLGLLAIGRDITERKEHEKELLRSNAELEQFSYAVSHDMRQPLRMISSYLQLLELSLADQLDSEKRNYFNFAIDGAKRIDQMLVALLEYSRVGRMGEPPTWIDSRAVLSEALLFLQSAIAEAQAKLAISGDWPRVFASHDEMLRLLQNLIGNAAKYRVAGRTPEITVTSETLGKEWLLSVADNGVGILPGQAHRLFQVFQRLHTHAAYEGTGIGLALCRKIVEHHGGQIGANSQGEGLGSTFWVKLPLHVSDVPEHANDTSVNGSFEVAKSKD